MTQGSVRVWHCFRCGIGNAVGVGFRQDLVGKAFDEHQTEHHHGPAPCEPECDRWSCYECDEVMVRER